MYGTRVGSSGPCSRPSRTPARSTLERASTPPSSDSPGPRPPAGHGTHHYIFTLYALDEDGDALGLEQGLDEAALMSALEGHILAQGELVGLYEREE